MIDRIDTIILIGIIGYMIIQIALHYEVVIKCLL